MKYVSILLLISCLGCSHRTPKVQIFDSKEFSEKVESNPSYCEEFELPNSRGIVNCLIYTGANFTYNGGIIEDSPDTNAAKYGAISDTVYVYSPVTGNTYNLNEEGWNNIVNHEPNRGDYSIWKFCVYSVKVRSLLIRKPRT